MIDQKLSHLDVSAKEEIEMKRQLINRIKANNREKLFQSNKEVQDRSPPRPESQHTSTVTQAEPKSQVNAGVFDKNKGVSDTDKMLFQKKFKNYLNHRQEYLDQARKRYNSTVTRKDKLQNIETGQAEYYNEEEVLSNTGSDYQYRDASDMQAAYQQMTTGKKRKGVQMQLFHCELYQNEFRQFQFEALLGQNEQNQGLISKDQFLDYLFDQPIVMMLYSINPYQLGDQLAQFQTKNNGFLTYQEFSLFLLTDREPTFFDYSPQNVAEARKAGRGIKCAPIIAKWIDQTGVFELLQQTYKSIDMRGDSRVDRVFLAKKLRKQAQTKRITELEVIQIININKLVPLNRLLYQIQFEERGGEQNWSLQEFIQFLQRYTRKVTPEKDRLITKLIMAGKYDSSYVYILSQEALQFTKDVFKKTPKFAEYFVLKQKFLENLCKDPRYNKIKGMLVRSQSNRYVKKETFEDTLVRILAEGDNYLDIEEVLDFLSNRGRPKIVEYKVYIENLERQLAIIEDQQRLKKQKYGQNQSASSDQEFNQIIKKKRVQRKHQKLKQIRNSNNFDINKKFNVTITRPFAFDQRAKGKKNSIRQIKIKQMLDQKQRQIRQAIKPIKPKEVPDYVKENLYAKMLKDQERQRKQRLQKFRLEIMSQINISERLMQPKSDQIHCDFSSPEYKFTARPMPWYCQVNLIDRINKKKQQRRQKILQQIINRNTDYDLPEGVQRMMQRESQRQQKRADKARTASTGSIGECTFVPKISGGVPDFKTIHQLLHFDLQNAKNVKQPIEVAPFSFQNRPAKSRTTYQPKPLKEKQQNVRNSKYEKIDHEEEYQKIPKTQKFEALVQHRRRQLELKERKQEQQKRGQAVRKLRQSKFAPVVWRALKNSNVVDPSKSRAIVAQRMKQFKRQERKKREQYENQMIRILTKVYQRPLLLQSRTVQNQNRSKSPQKSVQESNIVRSKVRKEQKKNKQAYLQQQIYNKGGKLDNLKLNLDRHNKLKQLNFDEDQRRKAVEAHQLGNYPAQEDDQQEYEQEDQDFDQMNEEQYEHGNLRTS